MVLQVCSTSSRVEIRISKSVILSIVCCSNMIYFAEDGKEPLNGDAPENNPQYTTVYVGNLAPEVRIIFLRFCSYGYMIYVQAINKLLMVCMLF